MSDQDFAEVKREGEEIEKPEIKKVKEEILPFKNIPYETIIDDLLQLYEETHLSNSIIVALKWNETDLLYPGFHFPLWFRHDDLPSQFKRKTPFIVINYSPLPSEEFYIYKNLKEFNRVIKMHAIKITIQKWIKIMKNIFNQDIENIKLEKLHTVGVGKIPLIKFIPIPIYAAKILSADPEQRSIEVRSGISDEERQKIIETPKNSPFTFKHITIGKPYELTIPVLNRKINGNYNTLLLIIQTKQNEISSCYFMDLFTYHYIYSTFIFENTEPRNQFYQNTYQLTAEAGTKLFQYTLDFYGYEIPISKKILYFDLLNRVIIHKSPYTKFKSVDFNNLKNDYNQFTEENRIYFLSLFYTYIKHKNLGKDFKGYNFYFTSFDIRPYSYLTWEGEFIITINNKNLTAFPIELAYLTDNLYFLSLSNAPKYSNIKKIKYIPNFITRFTSLEHLFLTNNEIHNAEYVDKLPNLKTLHLKYNPLKTFNVLFSQNNQLETLDLRKTMFNIPIDFFKNFKNLKELYLSEVNIDIIDLNNNLKLTKVDLSNNSLTNLPWGLNNLNYLEFLNLSNNKLQNINTSFLNTLPNLKELDLSNNENAHFNLTELYVTEIPNLTKLILKKVGLHYIKMFPLFNNLTYLDLSENNLKELPNIPFKNLTHLILNDNQLVKLPDDFNFPLLKVLKLNNNQIEILPDKFNFPLLVVLELNNNQLQKLPKLIYELKNLQELNLSHNKLPIIAPDILKLKKLQKLDLSHNTLTKIIPQGEFIFPSLKELNLANNQLTNLGIFKFKNLETLNISYNAFKELPRLFTKTYLENLKKLNLSGNKFEKTLTLSEFTNLEELILTENEMKIDKLILNSLTNLKNIIITKNRISNITLTFLPSITELKLSNNEIQSIEISAINLKELDLSKNKLKIFLYVNFKVPMLQKLNLSKNDLTLIDVINQEHLEELDLSYNQINSIKGVIVPNLKTLNLSYNQINSIVELIVPNLKYLNLTNFTQVEDETDIYVLIIENFIKLKSLLTLTYDDPRLGMQFAVANDFTFQSPNYIRKQTPLATTKLVDDDFIFQSKKIQFY